MNNLYDTIDKITDTIKKQRLNNDRDGLLATGLACIEYSYKLIDLSVENESIYRKFEASLADEKDEQGKRNSGAYCETQAKATDSYREWQKARQVIEVLNDCANMTKALAKGVDSSYNAS